MVTRTYKTGLAGLSGTVASGTTNTLPKYTAATTLGNSTITDNGTTIALSTSYSITEATGVVAKDAGVTTAGLGHPILVASPATATGLVAANTNFINFIPPAAAGVYEIKWAVDTTTATTDTFTVVVTYKNATGTARSQNSGGFDKAGTSLVAGAITSVIGAGNYTGSMMFSIDNSATAITLSTAGTFTTVTYNLDARLYVV